MQTFFTTKKYGIQLKNESYGVVNEREVRAVAGFMFALGLTTLLVSVLTQKLALAQVVIPLFLLEFALKVFLGPTFSVLAPLVRPLISHMKPEWVGAIQKRFAWTLGMLFAATVYLLLFGLGMRGITPFVLCSICLLLMWLESAAGICMGCELYARLIKKGYMTKNSDGPKCSGDSCEL